MVALPAADEQLIVKVVCELVAMSSSIVVGRRQSTTALHGRELSLMLRYVIRGGELAGLFERPRILFEPCALPAHG